MHSGILNPESSNIAPNETEVLSALAALVTEGRVPGPPQGDASGKSKEFHEGPHCPYQKKGQTGNHQCNKKNLLCQKYRNTRETVQKLGKKKQFQLYIEVFLACDCHSSGEESNLEATECLEDAFLLEQWHFSICRKRDTTGCFNLTQLVSAVRSQLYFSQLTAWLVTQHQSDRKIAPENLRYRLATPENLLAPPKFALTATKHEFPHVDLGNNKILSASFFAGPRNPTHPAVDCAKCRNSKSGVMEAKSDLVDDRLHSWCTVKGKHRCDDVEDCDSSRKMPGECSNKRLCHPYENKEKDLENWKKDKGQLLLDAIERSGRQLTDGNCDKNPCDIFFSVKENRVGFNVPVHNNNNINNNNNKKRCDSVLKSGARKRITFEEENEGSVQESQEDSKVPAGSQACDIPSASEQAKFRRNLGNAASMVFHSRTGLPLTSSPAPVRKGRTRFDFDSSLNSVSAIKSALFSNSFSTDDESESEGSIVSPCSPEIYAGARRDTGPAVYRRKGQSCALLGSFEESVLNGRLEPVSTVHGFTAELGASGSFVPKHVYLPVTVFFYSFGDNDQVSSPYLGHINLGKKGYNVPKSGTVQVTLFNPLGTVVKMFVIMYDLSDMPPNSQTFMRQRTLYMPTKCQGDSSQWGPKWLRYVIHLRFLSSKSNKIYLHSDIRMIVSKKSDMDTATAHDIDMSYELRSFVHAPANPRFSPRK